MSLHNWLIAFLLVIILVLSGVLIFTKPDPVVEEPDLSWYYEELQTKENQLKYWEKEASYWHSIADSLVLIEDSLSKLPPVIKYQYETIYKFIPYASNTQLDSLIRANL